jgi:hypothetical protein
MEHTDLFEELAAPAVAQRTPAGSHHYVADEDDQIFGENADADSPES